MKKELKEYSKPRMVMENFVPNSYCEICEDKEIISYTLRDPYPSWQHFVLDWNNDGICEESDLPHVQTTDNSQPEELEIQYAPALCWPSKKSHPTSLDDVLTYEPLWYAINPNNQSGHVYGYQTRIINYSHS
ncbi:MAG: hypothetical protein J5637_03985 [Prevotella sp.]|nr:hypothetical protein [Prevotella sp.]